MSRRVRAWSSDENGGSGEAESNRICDQEDGQTYAIFIQDAAGTSPAMQGPFVKIPIRTRVKGASRGKPAPQPRKGWLSSISIGPDTAPKTSIRRAVTDAV